MAREGKNNTWYIHLKNRQPPFNLHKLASALTYHVISQSLFTKQESNFSRNNVSFEINFREEKILKYVHVQMALPKKNYKCFFLWWNGAAVPLFNVQLQIIKNLLIKARWLHFVPKAVKKKVVKKIRLKHHISWTEWCCESEIAQNNFQVYEGGITVKPGQDSIHELIIWKMNQFVASVTCSRYQILHSNDRWIFDCNFSVYDEMENISMDEISS